MAKWLLSTKHIEFAVRDGVATIRVNRPDKRNAISQTMLHEFKQTLIEAGQPGGASH
jgi:enoyl-CoA hydratase